MKITVINNYDSFVFNLVRYLDEIEQTEITVMRNDKLVLDTLDESDAIVLSPGPGIPSEAGQLLDVIERFHQCKPILGVCLGHQAIGEFFGARLIQNETPIHGKSTIIRKVNTSDLFKTINTTFQVGRYHSWSIEIDAQTELQVIATTNNDEIMAIKHTSYPIYGVQFHPESILTPQGRTMIQNWVESIHYKPSKRTA